MHKKMHNFVKNLKRHLIQLIETKEKNTSIHILK